MRYFKSAFILGSTSSVAKSICLELARNGCKRFHLVCRNFENNKDLVKLLEKSYGAKITQEKNYVNKKTLKKKTNAPQSPYPFA